MTNPILLDGVTVRPRTGQVPAPDTGQADRPDSGGTRRVGAAARGAIAVPAGGTAVPTTTDPLAPYRPQRAPQPPTGEVTPVPQTRAASTEQARYDARPWSEPTAWDDRSTTGATEVRGWDDDDWDDEPPRNALPTPVRASVTAAATAPVPLLDRRYLTVDDDEEEDFEPVPSAPSLVTQGARPAPGVRDRPLQISWPWFGVALIAVAVLSVVAVLPI